MVDDGRSIATLIRSERAALAARAVELQYRRQPEEWHRWGEGAIATSIRDEGYHLDYLAEALATSDVGLFVHYVGWLKTVFCGLGFAEDALPTTLACTRDALEERLEPEEMAVVLPYLEAAAGHAATAPEDVPSFLPPDAPHATLARAYLEALLRGDRAQAARLVFDALDEGVQMREIYLWVFQPVQREVGRLWQLNRISVAKEHYCTAATQVVMASLYPRMMGGGAGRRRAVVTCVSGELHEVGARMVADFLEMDGWDSYYVGANAPKEGILRTIRERQPQLVAISTTMTFHLEKVRDLVGEIRRQEDGRLTIMVGGYPFNVVESLWRSVGADGFAPDAEAAVRTARELVQA